MSGLKLVRANHDREYHQKMVSQRKVEEERAKKRDSDERGRGMFDMEEKEGKDPPETSKKRRDPAAKTPKSTT